MSLRLHRWLGQRAARDLFTRPPGSLPALDGIRAFACAAIVFFHATVFSGVFMVRDPDRELRVLRFLGNAMWTGVDIFFVLSGFLIGRILIRDLERSGRVGYRRFYLRRSFRIFPAYYFVLSVILFVFARFDFANYGSYLVFAGAGSWESVRDGAWAAHYLYLSNYVAPTRANVMTWGWSLLRRGALLPAAPDGARADLPRAIARAARRAARRARAAPRRGARDRVRGGGPGRSLLLLLLAYALRSAARGRGRRVSLRGVPRALRAAGGAPRLRDRRDRGHMHRGRARWRASRTGCVPGAPRRDLRLHPMAPARVGPRFLLVERPLLDLGSRLGGPASSRRGGSE
jgi:hypothetical protein